MTYPNYSYQQTPVWQNPTISSTSTSTNGTGSPPTWWSALAGAAATCDPTSAWLNYSSTGGNNNSEVANAAAVAVAAYGTPYLGAPFSTLPTAGKCFLMIFPISRRERAFDKDAADIDKDKIKIRVLKGHICFEIFRIFKNRI